MDISHVSIIALTKSMAAQIPIRITVFFSSSQRRCISLRANQMLAAIAVA